MPEPQNLNLKVCDDVRQHPKGPLIGRVMYNNQASDWFYIAVPFSETMPQAFSTRWDAREYVERRGKPVMDASGESSKESSKETSQGASGGRSSAA